MMTYYYFQFCPPSGKCTNTILCTSAWSSYHLQSPTFKNVTSVKFVSLLHRRTMPVVTKPVMWTLDPYWQRKTGSRYNDVLSCFGKPKGAVTMSQKIVVSFHCLLGDRLTLNHRRVFCINCTQAFYLSSS